MFTCTVCNKGFFKRGNYNRHVARHNDANQYECHVCGKVFARRDNYSRHFTTRHSEAQIGYGVSADDEPARKRQRIFDASDFQDATDLYRVNKVKEVRMKKFKTKGVEYTVTFKENLDVRDPTVVLDTLHRVFNSLLATLTSDAGPKDLIRIVVTCLELDYPIQLPFIPKADITVDRFLSRIEQVIQSNEQL